MTAHEVQSGEVPILSDTEVRQIVSKVLMDSRSVNTRLSAIFKSYRNQSQLAPELKFLLHELALKHTQIQSILTAALMHVETDVTRDEGG